jgi:hypothetical protein
MEIKNLELKKVFFTSLNERQKRQFLGIESKELGHGGIKEVSTQFETHRETIRIGIVELETKDSLESGRIRKEGGGRKKNSKKK